MFSFPRLSARLPGALVMAAAVAVAAPAMAQTAAEDCWPVLRGPVHRAPAAQSPSPIKVHRYRLFTPAPKHYDLACATPEPVGPYLTVIVMDAIAAPPPPSDLSGPPLPVFAPEPVGFAARPWRSALGLIGGGGGSNPAGPTTAGGAIPEPSTWIMLIGGFMGVGLGLRTRRRALRRA